VARSAGVRASRHNSSPFRITLDTGEVIAADAVIVATQAWAAATLLQHLDPALGEALGAIPHVSSATVALAFRTADLPRPLHGFGYVVPRSEARPVLATTWLSAKWPGRAPDGFTLVRGFVGRAGFEDVLDGTDEHLVALVREELRGTLGIAAAPALHRVFRWDRGMPQYTLGHLDRVAAITAAQTRLPGLAIAGNAFTGVGLPDCIRSGETAAERVAAGVWTEYGPAVHARS
ncbi:MAG: protoporphyrinogen oxidase, partial [Chloroflexia bacterium]|nr:protoporphyrinogen oxidase [Chloroflexia bacterium]